MNTAAILGIGRGKFKSLACADPRWCVGPDMRMKGAEASVAGLRAEGAVGGFWSAGGRPMRIRKARGRRFRDG
jgi:hypothetical protein